MNTVPLWVTLLGFAAPLLTLAGSSVAYVVKLYLDASERRRNHFFELMQFIDSDRPVATKVAAIDEFRRSPEHKDFIIRFCEAQRSNVVGPTSQTLVAEMDATRAALQASRT